MRLFLVALLAAASVTTAIASESTPAKKPAAAAAPVATATAASEKPAPTPDEQVAALEAQCAKSAEARAARHAAKPLYERLGGEQKIHALTREVVRLHQLNPSIKHFFTKGDNDALAKSVAQFVIAGTGGPSTYEGRSLVESHAQMQLTNADFVSAGGDIIQAMKNLGYGQDEIDEVVCALVGLRDQVVLPKEKPAAKP